MSGLMDFDVNRTLAKFDAKGKPAKDDKPARPEKGGSSSGGGSNTQNGQSAQAPPTRAEELVDNTAGDVSREHEIREASQKPADEYAARMEQVKGLCKGREEGRREKSSRMGLPEFQSAVSAAVRDSISLNNVQKLAAIKNQASIRRGMGRDPELSLKKAVSKGQMSTVTIPTALLNYIRQQIGSLSSSTNQNDLVTGFLYWYFGQPDNISFGSEATYEKIEEIVGNLKVNASPSRASELSLNTSEAMREQLAGINEELDRMVRLLDTIAMDSLGVKMRSDKTYIGISYIIMNLLMRTEPVAKHQKLADVDFLAGGSAWPLMDGIDAAYEYFRNTNGREIYKARHGIKAARAAPVASYGSGGYDNDPDDDDQDVMPADDTGDDYEDIPMDFDPLNDDFDDMGVGSDFGPPGLDDPNYDDGTIISDREYLARKRREHEMQRRINAMEVDSETDD